MTRTQPLATLRGLTLGLFLLLGAVGCGSGTSEVTTEPATAEDDGKVEDPVDAEASLSEDASPDPETEDADADETDASAEPASDADEEEQTGAEGPTADELRTIVLAGWDDIFANRFDQLIPFYTADCRDRLTPEDFDLTIGEGIRSLGDLGIDLDEIELDVRIDDFVEGESAGAVTIATLPGEEPSEDPPQVWVIEDGEWRNPDCEDIAGVAATHLGEGDVGTAENPAALGSMFDFEDWRGGIVAVVDAIEAGVVVESDPPATGRTWLMVVYEAQYFGTEIGEQDPFILKAVGSSVYNTYDGDCILDTTVTQSQGLSLSTEALPGESFAVANCFDVPTDEVDELILVFEDAFSGFAPEIAYAASGTPGPDLPEREAPDFDLSDGALSFGEIHDFGNDWTVTVVAVVDGIAEGLISEWADEPPTGSTYPVVIYEATYNGPELTANDSIGVQLIGDSIHDSFQSSCFVDDEAAEIAYGTSSSFEFASGETYRKAECATAPADSVNDLVVNLEHYELFEDDTVLFAR